MKQETKDKISASMRGKQRTEQHQDRLDAARRGNHYPKISIGKLKSGYEHSQLTKDKISTSKKGVSCTSSTKFKKGESRYPEVQWKRGEHPSSATEFKCGCFGVKNAAWKGGFRFEHTGGYASHRISLEHSGCVWHHVNMMFMVACPEGIHQNCKHHVLGTYGMHGYLLEGVLG